MIFEPRFPVAWGDKVIHPNLDAIKLDGYYFGEFGLMHYPDKRADGISVLFYLAVHKASGTAFEETRCANPDECISLLLKILKETPQEKLEKIYQDDIEVLKKNGYVEEKKAPVEKARGPRVGAVYFIRAAGRYKIGKSVNPEQRINGMTLPEKPKILLIHHTPKYQQAEKELHLRFAEKRMHGEWFNFTEQELPEVEKAIRAF